MGKSLFELIKKSLQQKPTYIEFILFLALACFFIFSENRFSPKNWGVTENAAIWVALYIVLHFTLYRWKFFPEEFSPSPKKAISMKEIESYALQIESKHALFIFDSCFSGSLFNMSRSIPRIISEKTSKPVRQFITAGTSEQEVPDKSVFLELNFCTVLF